MFLIVLLIISFNHYKFAKYDNRNNIDIDSEIYVSSSVDYFYTFYGKEISISVPLYNKVIGSLLYFFGKNYFVLKMSYLLFLLFFLISLYCIVFKVFRCLEMSLVVVLMHLVIPGFISYSRMCWPQLYSSSFVLFSVCMFLCFLDENKKNIYFLILFFAFSCLACFIHYSSFIYIFLCLLSCVFLQQKSSYSLLLKRHRSVFVSLLVFSMALLIYYYQDWGTLLLDRVVFFKTFSYKNFLFILTHTDLFFFSHQFYLFWISVLLIFVLLTFFKNVKILDKLYVFFIACSISVLFYFVPYSIKVTVFSLTSGFIIISYFLVFKAFGWFRYLVYIYMFLAFIMLNVNPQYLLENDNKKLIKDKTALVADNRSWGMDQLEAWMETIRGKNVFVFSFYNSFYPENSVNYITYFDLKMLSSEKDLNLISNDTRIHYLIFDDIYSSEYSSFLTEHHLYRYKYVKQFLEKSVNFVEVKRIKCVFKDIVIYKTFGVESIRG